MISVRFTVNRLEIPILDMFLSLITMLVSELCLDPRAFLPLLPFPERVVSEAAGAGGEFFSSFSLS